MPEKKTIERARRDRRRGKAPSTQAGEFVREEIEHVREGKHGARSTKQAIAIGLAKARRAGVQLAAPKKGAASRRTRKQAERELDRASVRGRARSRRHAVRARRERRRSRRRAERRVSTCAVAPGGRCRAQANAGRALRRGEEGRAHPQGAARRK